MKSDVKQTLVRYRFHLAEINHISSSFCSAGGKKKNPNLFCTEQRHPGDLCAIQYGVQMCIMQGRRVWGNSFMLRQSCIVLMVSRTRIPTSANQQNFSITFSSRERKKDHRSKRKSKSVWLTCYCPRRSSAKKKKWCDKKDAAPISAQLSVLAAHGWETKQNTRQHPWLVSLHTPSLVAGAPPPCHSPSRMLTWA